jgi:transposase
MRGRNTSQTTMLSLVAPEQRVPKAHPLRRIKELADSALQALSPTFDVMYAGGGRPSVPPERLLKATLLMALYSVRSDRP